MTEREAVTSALAGPLVKARATSAGVAPCAPTPGRSSTDCGISFLASPTARGRVAPTTAPDAREAALPDEVRAPLGDELGDLLPDAPAVRERQVLDVGRRPSSTCARGRRCPRRAAARLQERLDRVRAEVRVHRQRVGERRLRRRAARGRRSA